MRTDNPPKSRTRTATPHPPTACTVSHPAARKAVHNPRLPIALHGIHMRRLLKHYPSRPYISTRTTRIIQSTIYSACPDVDTPPCALDVPESQHVIPPPISRANCLSTSTRTLDLDRDRPPSERLFVTHAYPSQCIAVTMRQLPKHYKSRPYTCSLKTVL